MATVSPDALRRRTGEEKKRVGGEGEGEGEVGGGREGERREKRGGERTSVVPGEALGAISFMLEVI
jgi:hypothetical protein